MYILFIRLVFLLCFSFSFLHQSSFTKTNKSLAKLSSIASKPLFRYRSLINMNNKKAVTLDVVVIYDMALYSIIKSMTAKQYFETRGQLLRDNIYYMTIASWDVIPGKAAPRYRLFIGHNAVAIIAFASYEGEDRPHRITIPLESQNIMILLNEKTLILSDSGEDYMEIGKRKEFKTIEQITKETTVNNESIPESFGRFYTLDNIQTPPSVMPDESFKYKDTHINITRNMPVKIDAEIKDIDKLDERYRDPHPSANYYYSKFPSFAELMQDKLKSNLFHKNGLISDIILKQHGIIFVASGETTSDNFFILIDIFNRNKYQNLIILNAFKKIMNSFRKNPLEIGDAKSSGVINGLANMNGSNSSSSSGQRNNNSGSANGQNSSSKDANNSNSNGQLANGKNSAANKGQGAGEQNSAQDQQNESGNSKNVNGDKNTGQQDGQNSSNANGNNTDNANDSDKDKNANLNAGINGRGNNSNTNNPQPTNALGSDDSNSMNSADENDPENDSAENKSEAEGYGDTEKSSSNEGASYGDNAAGKNSFKKPSFGFPKLGSLVSGLSSKFSLWNMVAKVAKKAASNVAKKTGSSSVSY